MALGWCSFTLKQWRGMTVPQWAAFELCPQNVDIFFTSDLLSAYTPGAENADIWTGNENGAGYCGPDNAGAYVPSVAGAYNG